MALMDLLSYRIHSEIEIEATPEQVWKVFGDFANWDKWSDFMVFPKVPERVGKHCRVLFRLDGGCMKETPHDPEILVLDVNKELRWRDYRGPLMSQFFRGTHWWILEPLPNGHTRLVHGAEIFGLALPFIQSTMHATRRGYHRWNKELRKEVLARMHEEHKQLVLQQEVEHKIQDLKSKAGQQQKQEQKQEQQPQKPVSAVARVARVFSRKGMKQAVQAEGQQQEQKEAVEVSAMQKEGVELPAVLSFPVTVSEGV